MSDDETVRRHRIQRAEPAGEVVTQAEIDDVLNDPSLAPGERSARLGDLRRRILDDGYADGDELYAPLQTRIMDALSMLAEGGHDYDGVLRVEGDAAEGRRELSPEDGERVGAVRDES